MANHGRYWILLTIILALGCWNALGQVANSNYKALRLPSGEPFPGSEAELLRMRDKPNGNAIRETRAHAWDVFAGLISGTQPIWGTWYTKCDLHLVSTAKCHPNSSGGNLDHLRLLENLEIPVQSLNELEELAPALKKQVHGTAAPALAPSGAYRDALAEFISGFRKHPQVASVLFNREASENILSNCLYPQENIVEPNNLSACPPAPVAPGRVAPFQRGAVVLKTVWAIVGPRNDAILKNDVITYAYRAELWDEIHSEKDKPNTFKREIQIDFNRGVCKDGDYGDYEAVPLDCFYHSDALTNDDLKAIPEGLTHLVAPGAWIEGNYLVLLGLHVTTKEISDWVWATFWWDNHGSSDWHANGRPKDLGLTWNHYLMNTTLSGMTPVEQDGGPKICFNPFLETDSHIPHGIISNCLQCHSKAGFGAISQKTAYRLGVLGRDGQRLASGDPPMPDYFDKMVSTDFLWSLATAKNPKLQEVLSDLQIVAQDLK